MMADDHRRGYPRMAGARGGQVVPLFACGWRPSLHADGAPHCMRMAPLIACRCSWRPNGATTTQWRGGATRGTVPRTTSHARSMRAPLASRVPSGCLSSTLRTSRRRDAPPLRLPSACMAGQPLRVWKALWWALACWVQSLGLHGWPAAPSVVPCWAARRVGQLAVLGSSPCWAARRVAPYWPAAPSVALLAVDPSPPRPPR